MIWYIVTGRIPYDDEDSIYIVKAADMTEADKKFREAILKDGLPTEFDACEDCETYEEGQCPVCLGTKQIPQVYINAYIRCETEPKIERRGY